MKKIYLYILILSSIFGISNAMGQEETPPKRSEIPNQKPSASVQVMNMRLVEMRRTVKSSENSATTAASDLQLNADEPVERDEFEVKINSLLTLIRAALVVESNAAKFHENVEQPIRMKSEHVCPSIALMDLIKGTAPFTASPETGKEELSYAVDLRIALHAINYFYNTRLRCCKKKAGQF